MDFQIISLNCRGLRDNKKRLGLFNWLKRNNKHYNSLYLLQETHSNKESEQQWIREWGADILYSHGDCNTRSVCILMPHLISYKIKKCELSEIGRYIQYSS